MLASIVPLVERARNQNWGLTVAAYVVGSVVGGALLGATSGLLGAIVLGHGGVDRPGVLVTLALSAAIGATIDLGVAGLRVPTVRRQVNEDWLHRYRGWVYGFGFGVQLGVGVVTIVTSAIVYLVLVLAFLTASWPGAAVIGGVFGLARALPIVATAGIATPARLREFHRRMQRRASLASRATVGVQGAVAALAVALVVKP
ncbi:MAG: hypothetical protein QOK20_3330 [Acidimicrobiaceae bacterium]|jgi:hypothetical protein|nr:hypothetical protein [Acidimicrobiaceae bacterium]